MKKILLIIFIFLCLFSGFALSGCKQQANDTKLGEGVITIPTHTIKAPKAGKILGLILERGERISKGQPLFAIEDKELDLQVEEFALAVAKAQAELKALEQGKPIASSTSGIAALQKNVEQAQQKATKMNQLLAAGAVSRKQAQQAQLELQNALATLQAASAQQQNSKPATPEELAAQKKSLQELQAKHQELLARQQQNEVLSPCTALVTEKLITNNDVVQLNQPLLKLLAQDTAIISCNRVKNAQPLDLGSLVEVVIPDSQLSFTGKITASDNLSFTVISTDKPEAVAAGTKVIILRKPTP